MANNLFGGNIGKENHIRRVLGDDVPPELCAVVELNLMFYHKDKTITSCQSVVVPLCLRYKVDSSIF